MDSEDDRFSSCLKNFLLAEDTLKSVPEEIWNASLSFSAMINRPFCQSFQLYYMQDCQKILNTNICITSSTWGVSFHYLPQWNGNAFNS